MKARRVEVELAASRGSSRTMVLVELREDAVFVFFLVIILVDLGAAQQDLRRTAAIWVFRSIGRGGHYVVFAGYPDVVRAALRVVHYGGIVNLFDAKRRWCRKIPGLAWGVRFIRRARHAFGRRTDQRPSAWCAVCASLRVIRDVLATLWTGETGSARGYLLYRSGQRNWCFGVVLR